MTDSATYRIKIESPHGKRAIQNWEHWLSKVADEAEERWGIVITKERIDDAAETESAFESAAKRE